MVRQLETNPECTFNLFIEKTPGQYIKGFSMSYDSPEEVFRSLKGLARNTPSKGNLFIGKYQQPRDIMESQQPVSFIVTEWYPIKFDKEYILGTNQGERIITVVNP